MTMLVEWSENRLWYLDMPLKKYGISFVHRMIIIKLANNKLLIHSPTELSTALQIELSQLGQVHAIVCPCLNSHIYLSEWWYSYPEAYFFATSELIQKRSDLTFDDSLSCRTPEIWRHQLLQTPLLGSDHPAQIAFFDPSNQTLLLGDLLLGKVNSSYPSHCFYLWTQGVFDGPQLPFYKRYSYRNKFLLRASVQEILTWPFDNLLTSNGLLIEGNAKEQFYLAFKWAFKE